MSNRRHKRLRGSASQAAIVAALEIALEQATERQQLARENGTIIPSDDLGVISARDAVRNQSQRATDQAA